MPTVDRENIFYSGNERVEITLFTDDTISIRYYKPSPQVTFKAPPSPLAASSLQQGPSSSALVNLLGLSSAMKSAASTAVQNENPGPGRDSWWHDKKVKIFVDQFCGDDVDNDDVIEIYT